MSDEDARKSLERMKGIGSWTADCYLMACLGRQDIWPVGDIGLQEGVRRLKDLKERPNVEDMTCLARESGVPSGRLPQICYGQITTNMTSPFLFFYFLFP